jgi:hypothetical protein
MSNVDQCPQRHPTATSADRTARYECRQCEADRARENRLLGLSALKVVERLLADRQKGTK